MTAQELEQQLLNLPPSEKLRLIQILAQSLNGVLAESDEDSDLSISEFFRQSPLAEAVASGELDLSRDRSLKFCKSEIATHASLSK